MFQAESLLTVLCDDDVSFVIIGGMAAVAHGSSFVTADLDICYQREPHNYKHLHQALRSYKPRLRGAPEALPFSLDEATLHAGLNFKLVTDLGYLDLLGEVAGLGEYEAVKARAEAVELYRRSVWILSLEGLIVSKEAAARPKDLRHLDELKALQALRNEKMGDGP